MGAGGLMDKLLDVPGLAELFGKSVAWVYGEVQGRRISHIRVGRQIRFTAEHVAEYLARGECPAITTPVVGRPRLRSVASPTTARGPRRIA